MGFVDKLKFWKKEEDFGDLGNIEDFGDFNLEEKPSLGGAQAPGQESELGALPSFEQRIGAQAIGEMQPPAPPPATFPPAASPPATPLSGMDQYPGSQEGFTQAPSMQPAQALYPQQQGGAGQPKYPQSPLYGQAAMQQPESFEQSGRPRLAPTQLGQGELGVRYPGTSEDIRHDLELMHSKLDTIKASLDSINARLANLERIAAGPENRSRYQW